MNDPQAHPEQKDSEPDGPFWIVWGSRGEPFVVGDNHKDPSARGPFATVAAAWAAIDGRRS